MSSNGDLFKYLICGVCGVAFGIAAEKGRGQSCLITYRITRLITYLITSQITYLITRLITYHITCFITCNITYLITRLITCFVIGVQ